MKQISQKIKINPNNIQKTYLAKCFGCNRFAYNWGVEQYNENINKGIFKNGYDLKKEFNALKESKFPFVYEVTKYATQQPFLNLNKAIKNAWKNRKKGKQVRLSFKKKSNHESFYIGGDQIKIVTKTNSKKQFLKIPLLDKPFKLTEKVKYNAKILSCTISHIYSLYFVSFTFEISEEELINKKAKLANLTNKAVGIDLGLKSALTLSIPINIHFPAKIKKESRKLIKLSRQLDRKVHPRTKGDTTKKSKNYLKASFRLRKQYMRIFNMRRDFIEKVSSLIVRNFDYICMEDLNVQGMLKNHYLAKAISDVSFYKLREKIHEKCDMVGKFFLLADRFFPSTKTCSCCGTYNSQIKLSNREFNCDYCEVTIDRDFNAATNLHKHLIEKIGRVTAEFTLADLTALENDFCINHLPTSKVETRNQYNFCNYL